MFFERWSSLLPRPVMRPPVEEVPSLMELAASWQGKMIPLDPARFFRIVASRAHKYADLRKCVYKTDSGRKNPIDPRVGCRGFVLPSLERGLSVFIP